MKIYLSGSISGGRLYEEGLQLIANSLRDLKHEVLSPFVADKKLNENRFSNLSAEFKAKAIYEEDIRLLLKADAVIAEVSQTSFGVGIEIGYACALIDRDRNRPPILFLKNSKLKKERTSFLIQGNPHGNLYYYDKNNIKKILQEYFESIK